MEIKKAKFSASLFVLILLASGISALGSEYPVGPGDDDWWTTYPDRSTRAGEDVNHPSWVIEALQEKPVMIYVNNSCEYCEPQRNAVQSISNEFGVEIAFFDLNEGSDARADQVLQAYEPNSVSKESPDHNALIVIVSLASNSDGEVVPVWHSSDQIIGDSWIRSYAEDALIQYDEFSIEWFP